MTVHSALDASAIQMETGFAGVVDVLSASRAGLLDLIARLEKLDRVLNDQRAQDRVIDGVEEATQGVMAALGAACAEATPPRIQSAYSAALKAVDSMGTQTRTLNAVASLSLITARSLGVSGFEDYVRDLRLLSDALHRDASFVGQAVAALRRRRERARELFAQADAALSEVGVALRNHASQRAEKDRVLAATIDGVGAVAERFPSMLAVEMDNLVKAMQFSDSAAQRLDHIRRILSRGGQAESALAAAQIEALVAATRDTLSEARASLARIKDMVTESGRALSADRDTTENQAVGVVELNRSLLSSLAEASESALQATEGAVGESAALQELAEEGARRFASLANATGAIHIAALNAALLARAASRHRKAINVLSVDVQQQAAVCARVAAACEGAMAELTRAEDLAVFSAVSSKVKMFQQAMAETEEAISAAGAALAELDALRLAAGNSLRALNPALLQAETALDRIAATADELNRLAEDLPRLVPAGSGPLTDLFDLYTMEAERVVHRRLFGLQEEPTPVAEPLLSVGRPSVDTASDADLLASVLF